MATANNRVTRPGTGPYLGDDTDHGYRAERIEAALAGLVAPRRT